MLTTCTSLWCLCCYSEGVNSSHQNQIEIFNDSLSSSLVALAFFLTGTSSSSEFPPSLVTFKSALDLRLFGIFFGGPGTSLPLSLVACKFVLGLGFFRPGAAFRVGGRPRGLLVLAVLAVFGVNRVQARFDGTRTDLPAPVECLPPAPCLVLILLPEPQVPAFLSQPLILPLTPRSVLLVSGRQLVQ